MNLEAVLNTLVLIGSDFPAYQALYHQVALTFSEADQATLRQAYADAKAAADRAHAAVQAL